jgi:hypothetical protein
MKNFKLLFFAMLVVSLGIFSSCEKEEDPDGPIISFTNDVDETTISSGGSWTITGNITSVAGLDEVKYYQVIGANETQLGSTVTSFSDKNDFDFSVTVNNISATMYFKVTATDKNDVTNSKSFLIKVGTVLSDVNAGKIYHIQASTGNGAWDLVADVAKMSADAAADKDMIQASTNTSGSAWVAGWNVGSGNTTMFVKANSYDYNNAYFETAKATYAAGSPSNTIRNVAQNDIYIAKLRGQDNYAVIKITKMDPADTSGTGGSNPGVIEFNYKKKP